MQTNQYWALQQRVLSTDLYTKSARSSTETTAMEEARADVEISGSVLLCNEKLGDLQQRERKLAEGEKTLFNQKRKLQQCLSFLHRCLNEDEMSLDSVDVANANFNQGTFMSEKKISTLDSSAQIDNQMPEATVQAAINKMCESAVQNDNDKEIDYTTEYNTCSNTQDFMVQTDGGRPNSPLSTVNNYCDIMKQCFEDDNLNFTVQTGISKHSVETQTIDEWDFTHSTHKIAELCNDDKFSSKAQVESTCGRYDLNQQSDRDGSSKSIVLGTSRVSNADNELQTPSKADGHASEKSNKLSQDPDHPRSSESQNSLEKIDILLKKLIFLDNNIKGMSTMMTNSEKRRRKEASENNALLHVLLGKINAFQEDKQTLQEFMKAKRNKGGEKKQHQIVLQSNCKIIVEDYSLTKTTFLDSLLESKILSNHEYERICCKQTTKERNRLLFKTLYHGSEDKFMQFVDMLREEFVWLHGRLWTEILEKNESSPSVCVFCRIQTELSLNNIAEELFSLDIMHEIFYEYLISDNTQSYSYKQQELWTHIFDRLNSFPERLRQEKVKSFLDVLNDKRFELNSFDREQLQYRLECSCFHLSTSGSFNSSIKSTSSRSSASSLWSPVPIHVKKTNAPAMGILDLNEENLTGSKRNKAVASKLPLTLSWLESVDPNQLPSDDLENFGDAITEAIGKESASPLEKNPDLSPIEQSEKGKPKFQFVPIVIGSRPCTQIEKEIDIVEGSHNFHAHGDMSPRDTQSANDSGFESPLGLVSNQEQEKSLREESTGLPEMIGIETGIGMFASVCSKELTANKGDNTSKKEKFKIGNSSETRSNFEVHVDHNHDLTPKRGAFRGDNRSESWLNSGEFKEENNLKLTPKRGELEEDSGMQMSNRQRRSQKKRERKAAKKLPEKQQLYF